MGNVPISKLVGKGKGNKLTKFQRRKLKYDFDTFFDMNNDGILSINDFLWAKDKICYMSGWKIGSDKYKETEALFKSIWASLEVLADVDKDGKITKTEWLLMWTEYKKEIIAQDKQGKKDFLKNFYQNNLLKSGDSSAKDLKKTGEVKSTSKRASIESNVSVARDQSIAIVLDSDEEPPPVIPAAEKKTKKNPFEDSMKKESISQKEKNKAVKAENKANSSENKEEALNQNSDTAQDTNSGTETEESILPIWLTRYLQFRFNLLDRTGDGVIDNEEFEYVLSEFGCSERVAKQAFTIVTKNKTVPLDFDYFVQLFEQFYLSDDPSDLGNFINGKLDYAAKGESGEEESDEDKDPGLEDHKVDSNASLASMDSDVKKKNAKCDGETIKLHETCRKFLKEKCDDAFHCCTIS